MAELSAVRISLTLEDPRDDQDFDRSLTRATPTCSMGTSNSPWAIRYYCNIAVPENARLRAVVVEQCRPTVVDGEITHAIAIDERGIVFDPSTTAPMTGTCTLEQYVRHNHAALGQARIASCYRVISK